MTGLRVVQWATGNIGTRSLRAVIEHPAMSLVGVHVHSADKVGHDAGESARLGVTTGVAATDDIDEILSLDADCVLYMPRQCDVDEVCMLLESGSNVVTTRGEFQRPATLDPDVRERVAAACECGGTSIHSTGSSPGFITEAVPLVLTSLLRRLDRLTIDEFANLSERDSPDLLFNIMGFGRPPADFDERRLGHLRGAFGPSLEALAESLGVPLDSVEARGEVALAPSDIEIAAGTLEAGTIAAQRFTVAGMRNGEELLVFRANWYCTKDLVATDLDASSIDGGSSPAWELQDTGWRIAMEGDTPLDVSLRFPIPLDRMAEMSPGYTAHRAVNAVAVVCDAPPGIRTTAELPQIISNLETL